MPRYDRSVTLVDSAGNPVNIGNPLPTTGGGGGGGGACTIADGADTCEGFTTDSAVFGDNPGTISAKLRGLAAIFSDVWDSINHVLKVSIVGSITAAATPNVTVSLLTSGARTTTTHSTDQTNADFSRMVVIVDVSAQSGGSATPTLQVKDSISNNYVTIWTAGVALTSVGTYAYYFADGANGGSFKETRAFGIPGVDWRLNMVHNNGSSITYSASAQEMK